MYLKKEETFESWYENPIDLPGRWYLQVIQRLFQENRLANGQFVGLGRRLNLHDITCPAYLLAGADDDITTPEQGLDAAKYLGTLKDRIIRRPRRAPILGCSWELASLKEHWPAIAPWIAAQKIWHPIKRCRGGGD